MHPVVMYLIVTGGNYYLVNSCPHTLKDDVLDHYGCEEFEILAVIDSACECDECTKTHTEMVQNDHEYGLDADMDNKCRARVLSGAFLRKEQLVYSHKKELDEIKSRHAPCPSPADPSRYGDPAFLKLP